MIKGDILEDRNILKSIIIALTIIQVSYVLFYWFSLSFLSLVVKYNLDIFLGLFYLLSLFFFIVYEWKYMPTIKNKKMNNTLMIFFLGIIGLWIWLPSKKEIEKY